MTQQHECHCFETRI